jgi:plastocyanin
MNMGVAPGTKPASAALMGAAQMAQARAHSSRSVALKQHRVVRVNIHNLAFGPRHLTLSRGTQVIWTNQDGFAHTTTSDNGVWDSAPINSGSHFARVFTKAGTFTYHCTIHPFMHGTITVTK